MTQEHIGLHKYIYKLFLISCALIVLLSIVVLLYIYHVFNLSNNNNHSSVHIIIIYYTYGVDSVFLAHERDLL